MTTPNATAAKPGSTNGNGQPQDPLAAAIAYEQEIADMAQGIRGEEVALTPTLFMELLPLLRKPIPAGFIQTTPPTKGKPYESTGIKSLQVQIDRLDNVLTPLSWQWTTEWSNDGRTATVEVSVLDADGKPLVIRRARGGVNQASTEGNLLKGSETNAAKLAFARLGVGHEVYIGATDFDPDVDTDAAEIQTSTPQVETIEADRAAHLRDIFDANPTIDARALKIKLGALGVTSARSVNHGLALLTPAQADELEEWLKAENGGEQS